HSTSTVLHRALDELVKELKLVGYVADTSLVFNADIEDEEKEIILRYNSEKLAITFGLLNTPPVTTIRVVKNLKSKLFSEMFSDFIISKMGNVPVGITGRGIC
ncbi:pentatricopeptide repeat-containing protein At2g02980, chloroplastic-like, partial [Gastrolobium bilobum]|uniref:pentatricopeptide repeat-containing protein At2g02980, chloroplastic-like n=1 Tax=Gastrolobium bilobum TaxID=150636 RepID=UPI002AAFEDB1